MKRSKAERQAWWAGLTPEQQAVWVDRWMRRKEAKRQQKSSYQAEEVKARLDLASERGCLMRDIPDTDVDQRLRENRERS